MKVKHLAYIVVITLILLAGSYVVRQHVYMNHENLVARELKHQYTDVPALLKDIRELGAQLVRCQDNDCRDVDNNRSVSLDGDNVEDGYYLFYPEWMDAHQDLIHHQALEIKRLTTRKDNESD